jgi:EmrB/QacA subfamily drug resistance transporter
MPGKPEVPAEPGQPATTRATRRWTLILGAFTSFLVGLDALVVATALPTLHQDYGGGVETLSWTVNAYQLAFAASILTGSSLGDRFGRRRVFIIGLAVFTVASALCALSPNAGLLIASRAAQGIGGGIAVPLALALITDTTPLQQRGKALGIWGALTGVAVAVGPLVGGAIVDGLAWQWIFWLNVPVGIAVAALATRKIDRDLRARGGRFDPVGLALATLGVFAIAQALIRGNAAGWSAPSVLGGLVGGVVVLVLFVAWERRVAHPMMPMTLLANRGFAAGCIAGFALMAGVYALGFLTAQYLQLALNHGPLGVGIRLLPATALALFLSPVAGRLADRVGDRPIMTLGLTLHGLGLLLIGVLVTSTSSYITIIGPLFVAGTGIAIAFPTVATAVMRTIPPAQTALASGISNTFRQVGAVFGVAVAAAIFSTYGDYESPAQFVDGYGPALTALGVVCVVAAVTAIVVRPPIPAQSTATSTKSARARSRSRVSNRAPRS